MSFRASCFIRTVELEAPKPDMRTPKCAAIHVTLTRPPVSKCVLRLCDFAHGHSVTLVISPKVRAQSAELLPMWYQPPATHRASAQISCISIAKASIRFGSFSLQPKAERTSQVSLRVLHRFASLAGHLFKKTCNRTGQNLPPFCSRTGNLWPALLDKGHFDLDGTNSLQTPIGLVAQRSKLHGKWLQPIEKRATAAGATQSTTR